MVEPYVLRNTILPGDLGEITALARAAELYRSVGFRVVEEVPRRQWGQDVVEQRYELVLDGP